MSSRYRNRKIITNHSEYYEEFFEDRDVSKIRQYSTPRLKHPTGKQRRSLTEIKKVWSVGDRFYKLAHQHYGDAKYWWVIAWYNQKPTEASVELGNVIRIPLPLEKVVDFLRV